MKVWITTNELYPVYSMSEDRGLMQEQIEIPEELYKEYKEVFIQFLDVNDKVESIYDAHRAQKEQP